MKLEYTGVGSGSRTFMVKGTPYRAGNNPTNRIIVVKPEHVQQLMATGSFRLVNPPVVQETPLPAPAAEVKTEVVKKSNDSFKEEIKAVKAAQEEKKQAEIAEQKQEIAAYNKPIEAKPMPGTLREIKAAFPTATMEDLLEWQTIEKRSEKPRKGVLVALEEEILER